MRKEEMPSACEVTAFETFGCFISVCVCVSAEPFVNIDRTDAAHEVELLYCCIPSIRRK